MWAQHGDNQQHKASQLDRGPKASYDLGTMEFVSTAKVLAKCMLQYYGISECWGPMAGGWRPCGGEVSRLACPLALITQFVQPLAQKNHAQMHSIAMMPAL